MILPENAYPSIRAALVVCVFPGLLSSASYQKVVSNLSGGISTMQFFPSNRTFQKLSKPSPKIECTTIQELTFRQPRKKPQRNSKYFNHTSREIASNPDNRYVIICVLHYSSGMAERWLCGHGCFIQKPKEKLQAAP